VRAVDPVRAVETGNGPDRLLDEENPATRSHVVATRWVRIYADLLLAKDSLMTDLDASIARSAPEAGFELKQIDGSFFVAERARYQRRLAFWEQRQVELAGLRG
jgi:hypothetical protein